MRNRHPKNERIKRQYFIYLEEAKRMSTSSVDQVAAAIASFEASTGYRDFAAFHIEQARKFKRQLDAVNPATGKPLAKATAYSRLMALKAFFIWLAGQPGYKSKLTYSDADYFNPSNNDARIAKARRERPGPTLEQIRHALAVMPDHSDVEKRDRALLAFAILSGARDDAIASMRLGHVDLGRRTVFHDARVVRTKNRKTYTSTFFPVDHDIEAIVEAWVIFLTQEKLFGPDDPLFPATRVAVAENGLFAAAGLDRRNWQNASPIREIFRRAFAAAGLPYFNPHSFRSTLGTLGERVCATPEMLKAWSQNLAHENVLTTLTNYGSVAADRQAELINALNASQDRPASSAPEFDDETVRQVINYLQRKAG